MGAASSHFFDGTGSKLVQAAKSGDASAMVELLSAHPDSLQYTTHRHLSPAHYAARSPNAEVLEQLLCKAEKIEFVLAGKQRALGKSSTTSIVQKLVNASSDRGVTPLMLAVECGCYQSVKLLLDKGADPWAVDKLGGRTALHYAARNNCLEVVQLLIDRAGEHGPVNFPNRPNVRYINVRTQMGFSAVHFAVHANAQESLAVLISNGANIMLASLFDSLDSISCARGSTPMHLAARHGNLGIAKQLLKAWVDIWHRRNMPDMRLMLDGNDQLPCQIAARRQHQEMARMLLPSTSIFTIVNDQDSLLGPPSLAKIARLVLHQQLAADLAGINPEAAPAPAAAAELEIAAAAEQAPAAATEPAGSHEQPEAGGADAEVVSAAGGQGEAACSSSCSNCSDGEMCGVCFDTAAVVVLEPCGHQLCVSCCRHLLALDSMCVMTCPFCRAGVRHLAAVQGAADAAGCAGPESSAPAGAADVVVPALPASGSVVAAVH